MRFTGYREVEAPEVGFLQEVAGEVLLWSIRGATFAALAAAHLRRAAFPIAFRAAALIEGTLIHFSYARKLSPGEGPALHRAATAKDCVSVLSESELDLYRGGEGGRRDPPGGSINNLAACRKDIVSTRLTNSPRHTTSFKEGTC